MFAGGVTPAPAQTFVPQRANGGAARAESAPIWPGGCQKIGTAHPKRHPVKARRDPAALGLEQRELGLSAIGRDHQGAAGIRSPLLRGGDWGEAQDFRVPSSGCATVWYEQLHVVDLCHPKRRVYAPTFRSSLTKSKSAAGPQACARTNLCSLARSAATAAPRPSRGPVTFAVTRLPLVCSPCTHGFPTSHGRRRRFRDRTIHHPHGGPGGRRPPG
jgi:hypothetical protein